MPTQVAHVRWMAHLVGIDPPDEDLEHLAAALDEHAQMMTPLVLRDDEEIAEYPDDDVRW